MGVRDLFFIAVVLAGAGTLGASLIRPAVRPSPAVPRPKTETVEDSRPVAASLDAAIQRRDRGVAPVAPDLAVMRRLSLALVGSIPSLEEIRRFEANPVNDRLEIWLEELLRERRTADYLAERFTRAFVGVEDGPFIIFRRRRFSGWLSDALFENRPYDAIVREMIAENGVWTDHPATNFITVANDMDAQRPDPERLGARVARAFLGVRLDCAQCHDHPFQAWKQADFRGLAAFFGAVHANLRGVRDEKTTYAPIDRKTRLAAPIEPRVPFLPELLPAAGSPRERLAAWVVDRRNPNFARATANRVWALLFGRPLSEPVDDIPADSPPALDWLADDFASHHYDLRRLIRVIARTETFRLDSLDDGPNGDKEGDWSSFPMTRLRPEQVASSIFQAASLSTIDERSFWVARLFSLTGRNDFVRRYGDAGEDEFEPRGATIPQGLLLMNGDIVRDRIKDDFTASAAIATLAPDDRKAIEIAYLAVLSRRPTPEESAYFLERLRGSTGQTRKDRLADLYWTLINATEFSWNH